MDSSSSSSSSSMASSSPSPTSIVSRAKTALHSAKAKAGKVFSDLKSDRDEEKQSQRGVKEQPEKSIVEGDSSNNQAREEDLERSIEVEDAKTSTSGALPPASVIMQLGLALETSKKFSSVKDMLSVKGSFVGEKTAAGFSVVKSLVRREKDKGYSDCSNEGIHSLIHRLLDPEEELSGEDSTLASFSMECMQKDIHAAPPKSFVVRLSKLMGSLKSAQMMASLWLSIVSELRNFWSEGKPIPHVPLDEKPDLNCCLLYQQLQTINCCISRKRHRAIAIEALDSLIKQTKGNEAVDRYVTEVSNPSIYARLMSGDIAVRLGVDKLSESLFMLETGEPIYSPVTQEGPILTTELIREAEEFVLRTGSLGAGCSQLLSDMQAFKAANPGCILEDFIRWHSPPDWNDMESNNGDDFSEVKRGRLSSRMLKEGNLWRELWETAKSVPAMHQTPLFDEDLAVESILSALDDILPYELFEQFFVCLLFSSFMIAEAALSSESNVSKLFYDCKDYAISACQCGFANDNINDLCKVYETVEMIITHPEDAIEITNQTEEKKSLFQKLGLNFSRERNTSERMISKDHKKTDDNTNVFSNLFERKSSLFSRKPSKPKASTSFEESSNDATDWTIV